MVHSLAGRRQRRVEISNILYAGKGMAVFMLFLIVIDKIIHDKVIC